jgi:hypothetical protein
MMTFRRICSYWTIIGVLLSAQVSAQSMKPPKNARMHGFAIPRVRDGKPYQLIRGKSAKTSGSLVSLESSQIILYPTKERPQQVEILSLKTMCDMSKPYATRAYSSSSVRIKVRNAENAKRREETLGENSDFVPADMTITGTGFDLDMAEESLRIRNNAKVVMLRTEYVQDPEKPNAEPEAVLSKTVITSTRMTFSLGDEFTIIQFDNNAKALEFKDGIQQMDMRAEHMEVKQTQQGRLEGIRGWQNVRVENAQGIATSDKLHYSVEYEKVENEERPTEEQLILTGNPRMLFMGGELTGAEKLIYQKETIRTTLQGIRTAVFRTEGGVPSLLVNPRKREQKKKLKKQKAKSPESGSPEVDKTE